MMHVSYISVIPSIPHTALMRFQTFFLHQWQSCDHSQCWDLSTVIEWCVNVLCGLYHWLICLPLTLGIFSCVFFFLKSVLAAYLSFVANRIHVVGSDFCSVIYLFNFFLTASLYGLAKLTCSRKIPLCFADVGSLKHWFSGEPEPEETTLMQPCSVHEQEDGTILGLCVTGKTCINIWHSLCLYWSLVFCFTNFSLWNFLSFVSVGCLLEYVGKLTIQKWALLVPLKNTSQWNGDFGKWLQNIYCRINIRNTKFREMQTFFLMDWVFPFFVHLRNVSYWWLSVVKEMDMWLNSQNLPLFSLGSTHSNVWGPGL